MFFCRPRHSSSIRTFKLRWLLSAFLSATFAAAQTAPTVTLTFDFPGSEPEHFVFSVASDGRSAYDSNGRLNPQAEVGEPFHLDFAVSQPTCDHIFDLAKRSHYFESELDSKKKNLAFTGTKVLSYKDGAKSTQASYNYSPMPAVQELTALFQNLSATLEFGRRLEYYHHYQKLALHDELKRLEATAQNGGVVELLAIGSILRKIVDDVSVINVDRARAQRLLNRPADAGPMR